MIDKIKKINLKENENFLKNGKLIWEKYLKKETKKDSGVSFLYMFYERGFSHVYLKYRKIFLIRMQITAS